MKLSIGSLPFIFICLLASTGCDDKPLGPDGHGDGHADGTAPVENPTLCDVSDNVFNTCITCHAPGATPPELTEEGLRAAIGQPSVMYAGETWVVPNAPEESLIFKKISWTSDALSEAGLGGIMPPSPPTLDKDALAMVENWIEAGAPADCSGGGVDGNEIVNDAGSQGHSDGNTSDSGTFLPNVDGGSGAIPHTDDAGPETNSSADSGTIVSANFCDIWTASFETQCTGCHSANSTPTTGTPTALTLPEALSSLVNIESQRYPGHTLVIPGNAAESLLYRKVNEATPDLISDGLGAAMPMSPNGLDAAALADIEAWINAGAVMPASCD